MSSFAPKRPSQRVRANAIWLMNAAALAIGISETVAKLTNSAEAAFYVLDQNGSSSAGYADYSSTVNFGTQSASSLRNNSTIAALSNFAIASTGIGPSQVGFGNTSSDIAIFGLYGYTSNGTNSGITNTMSSSGATSFIRFGTTNSQANPPTATGAFIFQRQSSTNTAPAGYTVSTGTGATTTLGITFTGGALTGTTSGLSAYTGSTSNTYGGSTYSGTTPLTETHAYLTTDNAYQSVSGNGGISLFQKADVSGRVIFANTDFLGAIGNTASGIATQGVEITLGNNQAFVNLSSTYESIVNMRILGGKSLTTYGDIVLGGGNTGTLVNDFSGIRIDAGTLTLAGANSASSTTPITVNGASLQSVGKGNQRATLRATGGVALTNVIFTGNGTNAGNVIIDARSVGSAASGYAFGANSTGAASSVSSASTRVGSITLTGSSSTSAASYTLSGGSKLSANSLTMNGDSNLIFSSSLAASSDTGLVADSLTTTGSGNIITLNGSTYSAGTYRILTVTGSPSIASGSLTLTGTGIANLTLVPDVAQTLGATSFRFLQTGNNFDLLISGSKSILIFDSNLSSGTWTNSTPQSGWLNSSDNSAGTYADGDDVTFGSPAVITTSGTISAGAVTISNTTGTVAISGVPVGALTLTKSGAGSASIDSANISVNTSVSNGTLTISGGTLTGAITVTGGTLTTSATGSGGATVSGGTLNANAAISGGVTVSTAGTFNFGANSVAPGALNVSGGTVAIGSFSGTSSSVTLTDGSITGSSGVLASTSAFALQSGTVSANLGGTSGLTKTTTGTVNLSGNNTLSGAYTVSAGVLRVGSVGAISADTGSRLTVTSGAALDLNGNVLTTTKGVTISGTGATALAGTTGAIYNSSASVAAEYKGGVQLDATSTIFTSGGNLTLSGALTSKSATTTTLNLYGNGNIYLSGGIAETSTSVTSLNIGSSGTSTGNVFLSGTVANTGSITINGGTLNITSPSSVNTTAKLLSGGSTSDTSNIVVTAGTTAGISTNYNMGEMNVGGKFLFRKTGAGDAKLTFASGSAGGAPTGRIIEARSGMTVELANYNLFSATTSALNNRNINFVGSGNFIFSGPIVATPLNQGTNSFTGSITFDGRDYVGNAVGTGPANGTFTLSGDNLYTGTTTVTSGTLKVGAGNKTVFGTGNVTVASGGVLDLNGQTVSATNPLTVSGTGISSGGALINSSTNSAGSYSGVVTLGANASMGGAGTLSLNGKLSGGFTINKVGSGILNLNASNDYTGITTVSAGTLKIGNASALSTAGITTNGGITAATFATLDLNGFTLTNATPLRISGGTYLSNSSSNAATFAGAISLESSYGNIIASAGDINITGGIVRGDNSTSKSSAFVLGGNGNINVTNSPLTDGSLGGILNVTVGDSGSSAGTVFFNGITNTYKGITKISGGTLRVSGTSALSASSTLNSGGSFNDNSRLLLASSADYHMQALSVGGNLTIATTGGDSTITFDALTGSGISGSSVGTASKIINISSGVTAIVKGDFTLMNNGATPSYRDINLIVDGNLVFEGAVSEAGTNSALAAGGINKKGNGTLTLKGTNTYQGTTTLTAGILSLGTAGALAGGGAINMAGGILQFTAENTFDYNSTGRFLTTTPQKLYFDTNGQNVTLASNFIQAADSLGKYGNGTLILSGTNAYAGGTIINGGVLQLDSDGALGTAGEIYFTGGTLKFNSGNTNDYSARFSSGTYGNSYNIDTNNQTVTLGSALTSATGTLTKKGNGVLILNSTIASSYTGQTTVEAGELRANADNVFSASSTVQVSSPALLNLNNFSQTIGGLSGSGTVSMGAGNLTISSGANQTWSGDINGSGNLTKSGTGALTFSTAQSYNGTTSISAGTLKVNGTLATSEIFVGGSAALAGSGFITAPVTVSAGGTITAGDNAVGDLSISNLSFTGAGTINLANISTTASILRVGNSLTAGGIITVNIFNDAPLPTEVATYNLIQASNLNINNFLLGRLTNTVGRQSGALAYDAFTGYLTLTTNGNPLLLWSGTNGGTWNTNTDPLVSNWLNGETPTYFMGGDVVSFTDTAGVNTVTLTENVSPGSVTINNSSTNPYTFINSGTGAIGGSGAIAKSGDGNVDFNVSLNNTGGLSVAGGTVALNRENTFTGGISLSGSGNVILGSASAAGTANALNFGSGATGKFSLNSFNGTLTGLSTGTAPSSAIVENGGTSAATLSVALSGVTNSNTYAGTLQDGGTGSLGLTKSGNGTLVLSGANNASGTVAVTGGTLKLSDGYTLGTAPGGISIGGSGTLELDRDETLTLSSGISGSGRLTLTNGTLETTTTNSFSGTASIAANATLFVGSGGAFSSSITGTNNGTIRLSNGSSVAFRALSGSGSLTIDSGSYTETIANGLTGTLSLGSTANYILAGSGSNAFTSINNDGSITIGSRSASYTIGANISGAGSLTSNIGSGNVLTLTSDNTYSGITTINNGKLQLGNGGTTGSIGAGPVTLNGGTAEIIFNRSDAYNLSAGNFITGTGAITLGGSGTVILSQDGQFGSTTAASTLNLNLGGVVGSAIRTSLDLNDSTISVSSLAVRTGSTSAASALGLTDLITIGDGKSLNVSGVVNIGANTLSANFSNLTVSGLGAFNVGSSSAATNQNFNIGISTTAGLRNVVGVDMSGLSKFNAYLGNGEFVFGADSGTSASTSAGSNVKLATDNTIQASNFRVGNNAQTATTLFSTLTLGSGTNTLHVDNIWIAAGASQSSARVGLASASGILTVRNKSGVGRANLYIQSDTSLVLASVEGKLDLSSNYADLYLNDVKVGSRSGISTTSSKADRGYGFGELKFGDGVFDATTVLIGRRGQSTASDALTTGESTGTSASAYGSVVFGGAGVSASTIAMGSVTLGMQDWNYTGTAATGATGTALGVMEFGANSNGTIGSMTMAASSTRFGNAIGTFKVTGGNVTVGSTNASTAITGADAVTGATSTANIIVNGGTLNLLGDIVKAGGSGGISNFNITLSGGGTLDMGGKSIGSSAFPIILSIANGDTATLRNVLSINGADGLTKTDTGILQLSGSNFATTGSGISVGGGTLELLSGNALGSGFLKFSGTSTLRFGDGITTDVSLRFTTSANANVTIDTGANTSPITFSNPFLGITNLTKVGSSTLILQSNSSFGGNVTISEGTLQLGESGGTTPNGGYLTTNAGTIAVGAAALDIRTDNALGTNASLVLNASSNLVLNDNYLTVGSLTLNGGSISGASNSVYGALIINNSLNVTTDADSLTTLSVNNITSGGANLQVNVAASKTLFIDGDILDGSSNGIDRNLATAITMNGTGGLNLGGNNQFTGGITLNSGRIITDFAATPSTMLGGASNSVTIYGGSLDLNTSSQIVGSIILKNAANQVVDNGSLVDAALVVDANDTFTLDTVQLTGNSSVTKNGNGTLTLFGITPNSGTSDYTGGTFVTNGTLKLGDANALGSSTGALSVSGGILDLNPAVNGNIDVGLLTISGSGQITPGELSATSVVASSTLGATAVIFADLSVAGGLTKTGNGTLRLDGGNTFSGTSAISAGVLDLRGTISENSGAINVSSGGTLRGNGTIGAVVNVAGNISPGTSSLIGTLTTSATNLMNGGVLNIRFADMGSVAGTGWDLLSTTGELTLSASNSNFTISLANLGEVAGFDKTEKQYEIIQADSLASGFNLGSFKINERTLANALSDGGTWGVSFGTAPGTANSIFLTYTPPSIVYWAGGRFEQQTAPGGAGAWAQDTPNWESAKTAWFGEPGGDVEISNSTGAVSVRGGIVFAASGYNLIPSQPDASISFDGSSSKNFIKTDGLNVAATISVNLSGSNGLIKNGDGTLTLSGDNAFTGGFDIASGILIVGSSNALGAASSVVTVESGAVLDLNGASISNTNPLIISGTGPSGVGVLVNNSTNASTYAGLLSLGADATISASSGNINLTNAGSIRGTGPNAGLGFGLTVTGSSDVSISGKIETGAGSLTKTGNGTLTLSGLNTYTGTTTISGGTLNATVAGALGGTSGIIISNAAQLSAVDYSSSASLTLGTSATATISGTNLTVGALSNANTTTNSLNFTGTNGAISATSLSGAGNTRFGAGATFTSGGISGGTVVVDGALNTDSISSGTVSVGGYAMVGTMSGGAVTFSTSAQIGSLNGGTIQTATTPGTTLTVASGVYSGGISGAAGLTKSGAGSFNLGGTNNYSGATTVTGGIMTTAASAIANSSGIIVSGGSLNAVDFKSGIDITVSGSGTASFSLSTGTVGALSNTNTAAQSLYFSGTGLITAASLTGAGSTRFGGSATITGGISDGNVTVAGALATSSVSSGTITVGDNSTVTALNGGTITIASGKNLTVTSGTSSGIISGGALVKTGTSSDTLTLSGENTFNGLTINAGTVVAGSETAVGLGAVTVTTGAVFNLNGQDVSSNGVLTLYGSGISSNGALVNTSTVASSYAGLVRLGAATTINAASGDITLSNTGTITGNTFGLTVSGPGNVNIASIIGTSSGTLTKNGTGTLLLSGANTYTGATTINAGTVKLGNLRALSTSSVALNNATLDLNGISLSTSNALTLDGIITNSSTTAATYQGGVAFKSGTTNAAISALAGNIILLNTSDIGSAGTLVVSGNFDTTINGSLSSSGSRIIKNDLGTLTLNGTKASSYYNGGITINAGTVKTGSSTALGGGGVTVVDGSVLDLNGQTLVTTGTLALSGSGILSGGALKNSGTTSATYLGGIILNGGAKINAGNQTLTLAGVISGSGALTVDASSNSSIINLNNSNSFNGGLIINSGNVTLGSTGALANNNAVSFGSASNGILSLNGNSVSVAGLNTNVTPGSTIVQNNSTTAAALTINNSVDNTFAGVLRDGAAGGALALTKSGNGKLTLTGVNTYTGMTTISSGVLEYTASGLSAGSFTNNSTTPNGLNFSSATGRITVAGLAGTGSTNFGANATISSAIATGSVNVVGNLNSAISGGTITVGSLNSSSVSGGLTTVNGTSALVAMSGGAVEFKGDASVASLNGGTATIGSGATLYVSSGSTAGTISGAGSLTKVGNGLLTLSGANSYAGTTTISAGTLTASDGALAGTSGISLTGGTNAAVLNAVNFGGTNAASLSLDSNATATISGSGLSVGALTNNNASSNSLNFSGTTGAISVFSLSGAGSTRFGGGATITGGISQGAITVVGALTNTIITGGNVSVGTGSSLGTIANGTALSITGDTAIAVLNGGTVAIGSGATLTVAGGNYSGAISGSGALTSTGDLTLSGSNTYTGATNISSASVLNLTGAIASGSAVTVASGATLKGTGTIAGSANISGTISAGVSGIGTLNLSGLTTLTSGGMLNVQFNDGSKVAGTGWDLLTTGALNFTSSGSPFTINLISIGAANSDVSGRASSITEKSYEIIRATSISGFDTLSGPNDTLMLNTLGEGTWTLTTGTQNGYTSVFANYSVASDKYLYWTGAPSNSWSTAPSTGGSGTWTASGWDTTKTAVFGSTPATVNVEAGGVTVDSLRFNVGGYVIAGGDIAISAAVGDNFINTLTGNSTISSKLVTTSGINKTGVGTLIFINEQTYTGNTTVTEGMLQLGDGISNGSVVGNVTAQAGAQLSFNNTGTQAFGGIISGQGSLTKTGNGTLSLSASNSYTGDTTVSNGTLIATSGALGSTAAIFVNNTGSLTAVDYNSAASLTVGTSATASISGTNLTVGALSNANTTADSLNFSGTTGAISAASLSGAGSTRFASNATIRTGDVSNGTLNVAGALTLTAGSITGGTVNANSLSAVGISAGTVSTAANANLTGNISGTTNVTVGGLLTAISITGGTVAAGALSATSIAGGNTTVSGTSALGAMTSGTATFNGDASVTTLTGGNISIASTKTLTVSSGTTAGTISGAGSLTKISNGALQLTSANSYSGTTAINSGTLDASVSGALGSTAAIFVNGGSLTAVDYNSAASLTVGTSATASISGTDLTVGALSNANTTADSLNFSGTTGAISAASLSGAGNTRFASDATIRSGDVSNGTLNVAGALTLTTGSITGGTVNANSLSAVGISAGTVSTAANANLIGNISSTANVTVGGLLTAISITGGTVAAGALSATSIAGGNTTVSGTSSLGAMTSGTATFNGDASVTTLTGGNISIASTKTLTVSSGTTAGTISGAGSLTKISNGALQLTSANSYSGTTAINSGTLDASVSGALGSTAAIFVNNTGSLTAVDYNSSASLTVGTSASAAISGTDLTVGTLTNANTTANSLYFTGTTGAISAASLSGAGNTRFASNATIRTGDVSNGTLNVAGALTLTAGSITGGTVSAGVLSATSIAGGNTTVSGTSALGAMTSGTATFNGDASVTTLTGGNISIASTKILTVSSGTTAGTISGAGSLTKIGNGALQLSSANNYSGDTNINGGILSASVTGALGSTAAIFVNGGSLTAVDYNSSASLTVGTSASAVISGTTLTVGALSNANTTANSLNFSGTTGAISAASLTGSGSTRFGSDATITGGISQGNVTVVGALTGTAVSGGTVSVGAGSSIASIVNGTTLNVNGNTSVTTLNGGTVSIASGKTLTVAGGNSSDVISGSGALTSTGNLTLSGANTYTGATLVSAGTLTTLTGALANTSGITVNGATLAAADYNAAASLTLNATGSATISGTGLSVGALTNANTTAASLNFSGNTGTITAASLTGAGNTRFGSNATITGGVSQGTVNTVGLLASNITGGTVTAGSLSSSSISGGTTTVSGTSTVGTLSGGYANFNGNAAVATLNGGTVAIGSGATLTVAAGNYSGVISGSGALTSTGNLTLSGANTYTGATNITSASVFNLTGSLASSSAVTLSSGATLKGTGTAAGSVNVSGAISPGTAGVGTLTTGATTLNGGGTLNIQFHNGSNAVGTGWDLFNTGDLTINATAGSKFTINLISISNAGSDTTGSANYFNSSVDADYEILRYSSLLSIFDSSVFSFVTGTFANSGGGTWSLSNSGNSIFAHFASAPLGENEEAWNNNATDLANIPGTNLLTKTVVFNSTGPTDASVNVDPDGVELGLGARFKSDFTVGGLGSGEILLSGATSDNTLTTDTGATVTINSNITTPTGMTKEGAGTLILASVTANNLGDVEVNDGKLILNTDANTDSITVESGATLGGRGNVAAAGDVVIKNGGFLSPGNSPGVFTQTSGDLDINGGATYVAELGGTTPGNTNSNYDQYIVENGAVNIGTSPASVLQIKQWNGFTLPVGAAYFTPVRGDAFQVLKASQGIKGEFTKFDNPDYNQLMIAAQHTGMVYATGLTGPQTFVAWAGSDTQKQNAYTQVWKAVTYSQQLGSTNPASYAAFIDGATYDGKVAAALIQDAANGSITSFSPESYFGLTDYALTISRSITSSALDQTSFYKIRRWTVGADYNNVSNSFSGGSSSAFDRSLTGQTSFMTLKYEFNDSANIGFFIGMNTGSASTASSRTDFDGTVFGVTAYKSYGIKYPKTLKFAYTHTDLNFDSRRSILGVANAATTNNQSLTSDSLTASAEVRLYKKRYTSLSPYVGVSLSRAASSSFTESGASTALKVDSASVNSARLSAGFEVDYVPTWRTSYALTAGLEHELGRAGQKIEANYVGGAPADKFTTTNPSGNQTNLAVGASANYRLTTSSMMSLGLQLRAGGDYSSDRSVNVSYKKKF